VYRNDFNPRAPYGARPVTRALIAARICSNLIGPGSRTGTNYREGQSRCRHDLTISMVGYPPSRRSVRRSCREATDTRRKDFPFVHGQGMPFSAEGLTVSNGGCRIHGSDSSSWHSCYPNSRFSLWSGVRGCNGKILDGIAQQSRCASSNRSRSQSRSAGSALHLQCDRGDAAASSGQLENSGRQLFARPDPARFDPVAIV